MFEYRKKQQKTFNHKKLLNKKAAFCKVVQLYGHLCAFKMGEEVVYNDLNAKVRNLFHAAVLIFLEDKVNGVMQSRLVRQDIHGDLTDTNQTFDLFAQDLLYPKETCTRPYSPKRGSR